MKTLRAALGMVILCGVGLMHSGCTNLSDDLTYACETEEDCVDGYRCVQLQGDQQKACVEWPPGDDVELADGGMDTQDASDVDPPEDASDTTDVQDTEEDTTDTQDTGDTSDTTDGDDGDACVAAEPDTDSEQNCDGEDSDCDGVVDEGCGCSVGSGLGVCADGTIDPSTGDCEPPADTYEATETTCDNLNNDCDEVVDENCECDFSGGTEGVCAGAIVDETTGECTPPSEYQAGDEGANALCDGVDNNCDGVADDGCTCTDGQQGSCFTGNPNNRGVGECSDGSRTCQSDGTWGDCSGDTTSVPEICDNLDNDCDGSTDENCPCDYTINGTVETDGVCGQAKLDDFGSCIAPNYETDETTCDNEDNDCDGVVDEGCPCDFDINGTIYTDGVCGQATTNNSGSCVAPDYETDETTCDGKDNDCDGGADEGCSCDYLGDSDGVCANQTRDSDGVCQQPSNYEAPEGGSCADGADNDCDGDIDCADDSCASRSCEPNGTGAICSSSGVCTERTCTDGVDNDGDNTTDCDDPNCTGRTCGTGTGATCQARICRENFCGDGNDNDGDGNIDCDDSDCLGTAACPTRAFVTSFGVDGNMTAAGGTGRQTPDDLCQGAARNANILRGGSKFVAVLSIVTSSGQTGASTRLGKINVGGQIVNTRGKMIADSLSEFFDDSLDWRAPLRYDASGSDVGMTSTSTPVWTGTTDRGGVAGHLCEDSGVSWNTSGSLNYGTIGDAQKVGSGRMEDRRQNCSLNARLYCIEAPL